MCPEIYEIDTGHFFSPLRLACKAALKKIKVKLILLTDIYMFLMVENSIRYGICLAICRYVKAKKKYMKDYNKDNESSYLKYWDVNNLYGRPMSQKLPVDGFSCVENTSQFHKNFVKNYNQDSDQWYFLEAHIKYPEKLHYPHNDLLF